MSATDIIQLMLAFGTFVLLLLGFVVELIEKISKRK